MTQFNIDSITPFVQQNWSLNIQSSMELRNSNKFIVELIDEDENHYILKGEKSNVAEMHKICHFANSLQPILPTVRYLMATNLSYSVMFEAYVFTLETKLEGQEIDTLEDVHLKEIGTNLGKMHCYSLQNNLNLNKATSWSMFGGNATDAIGDYDENELSFLEFTQTFQHEAEFPLIQTLYENYRQRLQSSWTSLPKAAIQGDFCYYNMLFEQGKLVGLFDFNLAGDEILLNECVAVGIYLSWHVTYNGNLSSEERFKLFLDHYRTEREWMEIEWTAFPMLFAIIRAFRYDRVEKGIAEPNNKAQFLEETKMILLET